MDCGWQNPERAANNHSECWTCPAYNAGCIAGVAPPQTSGMRDVLFLIAMMISLQATSGVMPKTDYIPRVRWWSARRENRREPWCGWRSQNPRPFGCAHGRLCVCRKCRHKDGAPSGVVLCCFDVSWTFFEGNIHLIADCGQRLVDGACWQLEHGSGLDPDCGHAPRF